MHQTPYPGDMPDLPAKRTLLSPEPSHAGDALTSGWFTVTPAGTVPCGGRADLRMVHSHARTSLDRTGGTGGKGVWFLNSIRMTLSEAKYEPASSAMHSDIIWAGLEGVAGFKRREGGEVIRGFQRQGICLEGNPIEGEPIQPIDAVRKTGAKAQAFSEGPFDAERHGICRRSGEAHCGETPVVVPQRRFGPAGESDRETRAAKPQVGPVEIRL